MTEAAKHPFADTLNQWAAECEQRAADYRTIAKTDPARYRPAMEGARQMDRAAREYRAAVARAELERQQT